MSDNGPYTQPPQYPGGEGNQGNQANQGGQGGTGGQPAPYGGGYGQGGPPPGQPDPGQQGGYPSGPYQAPYGEQGHSGQQQPYPGQPPGPYGTGSYPGQGGPQFQHPQEQQQMFHQGGQPPYGGGPGGPGYPPPPPQQPRKSSAGLWIVLAGGVVIVLLVVAVVVVLFTSGGGDEPTVAQPSPSAEQEPTEEPEEEPEAGADPPSGEAPYALPADACVGISEDTLAEVSASDNSKSTTDSNSTCSWSTTSGDDAYGTLSIEYKTPYSASDSTEAAQDDYAYFYDYATNEEESIFDLEVIEEQELSLGDESVMVFAEEEIIGPSNRTTVLIRQDNMTIKVEWSVSTSFLSDSEEPSQEFSDVEDLMPRVAEEALSAL